jgi:hypothetical protein
VHAIIFSDAAFAAPLIAGVSVLERLLRTLARSGVTQATLVTREPGAERALARNAWAREGVSLTITAGRGAGVVDARDAWPDGVERALIFPSPGLFDTRLIKALVRRSGRCALVDSAPPAAHSTVIAPLARARGAVVCGPAAVDLEWLSGQRGDLRLALLTGIEEAAL